MTASEFVEVKLQERSNVIWWSLTPRLCRESEPTDDQKMAKLLDVLEEFFNVWRLRGPAIIYSDWLRLDRGTVADDLLRFGVSPVGETVAIDNAVEQIGINMQLFLRKVRDQGIRLGLEGGQLHIRACDLEALLDGPSQ